VSGTRRKILVVAGLIVQDGLILIGQRKNADRHPLKWEFPGGKVEPGENPREALARELREELGIEAVVGPEIIRYEHHYPKRFPILLMFHRVDRYVGEPVPGEFQQIRWERPENLPSYDFLDGDVDFVRRLARGQIRL
jgi:ADP-ribose pyrophosphatase